MAVMCGMNKNFIFSIIIVVLLGLGLWWFISMTTPDDSLSPIPAASISSSISPSPTAQPNITISSPIANQLVDSPILVTGTARVFENQFTVQIKDSSGKIVASAHVFSDAKDAGQFGNYSVKIPIPVGTGTNFKIEALSYAPKGDGSFEGYASVSVKLKSTATANISVAFMPTPVGNDCTVVKLFSRSITKTLEVAYLSLYELLKGPTLAEKALGAVTQIPEGTQINSVRRSGDTIYADFNEMLEYQSGGSCHVQAIRSQITNTLKQFSGVNNVVISINGKTEDILQP